MYSFLNGYNVAKDYDKPMPGEGPFFTDYLYSIQEVTPEASLESLNWNETQYPALFARKEVLVDRFNRTYAFREIGQETVSRWLHFLQLRFDEVAERYNHAYNAYANNDIEQLGTGYKFTRELSRNTSATGNYSNERQDDSKFKDTPSSTTSTLNNPTSETINNRDESGNTTESGEQTDNVVEEKQIHDEHTILEVNTLIDRYKTIDNDFIEEFDILFMGITMGE